MLPAFFMGQAMTLLTELYPILIFTLLALGVIALTRRLKNNHRYRVKSARRVMQKLYEIPTFEQRLAYLRKIDAFVFEELILEALERRGHKIKRNERYTGDGGIDGQCWIQGQHTLIQAKRYKSHIRLSDVKNFQRLIEQKNCYGLFVHTGKTGQGVKEINDPKLLVISGKNLIDLVTPKQSNNGAKKGGLLKKLTVS